ncbi:MAG: UDP-N-acetylglucosamine 2-epimerase (non-hydrolyzing) [Spirochaetales bacterium]|nr:UDP-N-acetylglucosamine 2-epimerase (non-hydrolyzing) [Spirochaetales bacterium]
MFLFGTRPEAIKMAPLIGAMKKRPESFQTVVCVSAQHREMLDQVLEFFQIVPDFDLDLMKPDQSLLGLMSSLFTKIEPVLDEVKPDLVFVQGDTTTVMAGAVAAFLKQAKVVHIEAGLRTGNKMSPFPEEMNRILAGHTAEYHFAPTPAAVSNLAGEGIVKNVWNVGNTVIDALLEGLSIIEEGGEESYFGFFKGVDFSKRIILVTSHRRESFGDPMRQTCRAVKAIAEKYDDVQIVFPVHLNPRVKEVVNEELGGTERVHLIEPLDYPRLIWMMKKSYLVLTDSGGIQEEAPSLGKPVLVLREVTERQEGIDAGTAILVGTDRDKIIHESDKLLTDEAYYQKIACAQNPYGDGSTSKKVLDILESL